MLFETFNRLFFWVFVVTNIVFCSVLIWKIYAGYRASESKTPVVVKAFVSLLVWFVSNAVIIVVSAGYFAGHAPESAAPRIVQLESATVYLISFIIGWIFVGAGLLFWMSREPNAKKYGSNKSQRN